MILYRFSTDNKRISEFTNDNEIKGYFGTNAGRIQDGDHRFSHYLFIIKLLLLIFIKYLL